MITELLQERSALYASGTMSACEREQFELVLEFHHELRGHVAALLEVAAQTVLAHSGAILEKPSSALKSRILGAIAELPQRSTAEGLVMTAADGLVQWVNPAFSAMCGYTVEELSGKKLGPILQGEKTDRATVERMRRAVHEYRPCTETILNYHKNGTPYWVEIAIIPILDDAGKPLWLVAREKELAELVAA